MYGILVNGKKENTMALDPVALPMEKSTLATGSTAKRTGKVGSWKRMAPWSTMESGNSTLRYLRIKRFLNDGIIERKTYLMNSSTKDSRTNFV